MSARPQAPERRSYLLRLHNPAERQAAWRASLQEVRSGEWRHFTDLSQLFVYLSEQAFFEQTSDLPEKGSGGEA
jgi:hypothetical protein